jgi:hypothetical protein
MAGAGDLAADVSEADTYELLRAEDIDGDPPGFRPVGPGDVFSDVSLDHLSTPIQGPVIVVGHPCSIRRGLDLQDDLPVAPIVEPGIPTHQHSVAERVLPVQKLLPPGSDKNRVIQLTLVTTVPATLLDLSARCASLNRSGVVALQQRVVGNQTRIKVPAGVIAAHCRGPLAELELWTDWRETCVDAGEDAGSKGTAFNGFMESESGFEALSWREALGAHEHAQARAAAAMETFLAALRGAN